MLGATNVQLGHMPGFLVLLWHTMRRLIDIDLLEDEQLQASMASGSMAILLAGVVVGVFLAIALPHEPISIWWFVQLAVISIVALPVHELVHAAAFKLVSGFNARLKFGFTNWMLYTASPGTILTRSRFCIVLLAPSVVVTLALWIGAAVAGEPLLGWFLAVIHLAGCTGDIGYVRIIRSERNANLVQDTERGIALFHDE